AHELCEIVAPADIDVDGIGRPDLGIAAHAIVEDGGAHARFVGLGARHEAQPVGNVVVVGDQDAALLVDRHGAPILAAIVAGILDVPLIGGGRGVDALIGRVVVLDTAPELVERGHAPHVPLFNGVHGQRVVGREGL